MLNEIKSNNLLSIIKEQKKSKLKENIYHYTQVKFAYNTNRIEGSKLSEEDTRYIFETANHFYLFDQMIENPHEFITEKLIKKYHEILKNGTTKRSWNTNEKTP